MIANNKGTSISGKGNTKRSHKKSKNGCISCKQRRVKCDEITPSCTNCVRRGTTCTYPKPPGQSTAASPEDYSSHQLLQFKLKWNVPLTPDPEDKSNYSKECIFTRSSFWQKMRPSAETYDSSLDQQEQHEQEQHDIDTPSSVSSYEETLQMGGAGSTTSTGSTSTTPDSSSFTSFGTRTSNELFTGLGTDTGTGTITPATIAKKQQQQLRQQRLQYQQQAMTIHSRQNLILQSNNPDVHYPNFIEHTKINKTLNLYYRKEMVRKLSSGNASMHDAWSKSAGLAMSCDSFLYLMLSVSALSLRYDILEGKQKAEYAYFKDPKECIHIDQMSYREFLTEFDSYKKVKKSKIEDIVILTNIVVLNMIHQLLSPDLTICDMSFYELSSGFCDLAHSVIPSMDEDLGDKVSYYNPFNAPTILRSPDWFFPSYLYQLSEVKIELGDNYHNYDRVQTVLMNEKMGHEEDEELQDVEHVLKFAVNILKREYTLASSNHSIHGDCLTVLGRFPSLMPKRFLWLISIQDSRALVIMAHFILLIASLRRSLLPDACLRDELSRIDSVVQDQWRPWLDLPKRTLGLME